MGVVGAADGGVMASPSLSRSLGLLTKLQVLTLVLVKLQAFVLQGRR